MSVEWFVYIASAIVIFMACTFAVLHPQYEDGLVGRIALTLMAASELFVLMEAWVEGETYVMRPTTIAMQVGFAVFLMRHLYRFLRWRFDGSYQWREAGK